MFQRVRKHLTPATFIALLALVFAVTGGAFAATGNGGGAGAKASAAVTPTATAAKAKKKAAPTGKVGPKGPAGAKGATGATGATGPAGATGPGGAQGAQGPAGANGTNGENGKEGTAGKNGKEGKEGKEGALGTAGTTLPAGASETGTWSYSSTGASYRCVADTGKGNYTDNECKTESPTPGTGGFERETVFAGATTTHAAITIAVPLAFKVGVGQVHETGVHAHFVPEGATPTAECPGTVKAPSAAPGNLCIYEVEGSASFSQFSYYNPEAEESQEQVGAGGVLLSFFGVEEGAQGRGDWVVTAPAA
jgi:hypothetical protein